MWMATFIRRTKGLHLISGVMEKLDVNCSHMTNCYVIHEHFVFVQIYSCGFHLSVSFSEIFMANGVEVLPWLGNVSDLISEGKLGPLKG